MESAVNEGTAELGGCVDQKPQVPIARSYGSLETLLGGSCAAVLKSFCHILLEMTEEEAQVHILDYYEGRKFTLRIPSQDERAPMLETVPYSNHPKVMYLSIMNEHRLDDFIDFHEETHTYSLVRRNVNGAIIEKLHKFSQSVSAVWSKNFDQFDADGVLARCVPKWEQTESHKNHHLVRFMTRHILPDGAPLSQCNSIFKQFWSHNGLLASSEGTSMHRAIEYFLNLAVYDGVWFPGSTSLAARLSEISTMSVELSHFAIWIQEFCFGDRWGAQKYLIPYRTELSMWDSTQHGYGSMVAGQADCIFRISEEPEFHLITPRYRKHARIDERPALVMVDWKRVADPLGPGMQSYRNGAGLCGDIPDTSYSHYAVQQSLYKAILQQNYGFKIEHCYLAQFHPGLDGPRTIELNDPIFDVIAVRLLQKEATNVQKEAANIELAM